MAARQDDSLHRASLRQTKQEAATTLSLKAVIAGAAHQVQVGSGSCKRSSVGLDPGAAQCGAGQEIFCNILLTDIWDR